MKGKSTEEILSKEHNAVWVTRLFRYASFFILFVLLYSGINGVFLDKTRRTNISTFYDEPRNSLDVIFLGTSHTLNAFTPLMLWGEYGIPSYNFGQAGQPIDLSYYCMEEALRLHQPSVCIIDLYGAIRGEEFSNFGFAHTVLDNFRWSPVKVRAIWNAVKPDMRSEYFFPLIRYHSRWSSLSKNDFFPPTNRNRGATEFIYALSDELPPVLTATKEVEPLPARSEKALQDLIILCRANNVELVFVLLPYRPEMVSAISAEEQLALFNYAERLAENEGVSVLNLLEPDAIPDFEYQLHMRDPDHVNTMGAELITSYFGQYLKEHYDLPDRRLAPEYAHWNDDYIKRQATALLKKGEQLPKGQYLPGYLELIRDEADYIVIMATEGKTTSGLDVASCQQLASLGLETDLDKLYGQNWMAVIDGGEVVLERASEKNLNEALELSGLFLELSVHGEELAELCIDGEIVGQKGEGLNIVVYSKSQGRVLDSVLFNGIDASAERN